MKKYLYLICLLCCCAFAVITISCTPCNKPTLTYGADDCADNKVNYKFKKMNEVNIRQKDRTVYVNKKGKETTTLVVAVKDNALLYAVE